MGKYAISSTFISLSLLTWQLPLLAPPLDSRSHPIQDRSSVIVMPSEDSAAANVLRRLCPVLERFSVEDKELENMKLLCSGLPSETSVDDMVEKIREYLEVGDGFDWFVIESVFMTNLHRRLTVDNDSNPFRRVVREGLRVDRDHQVEEARKREEARKQEEEEEGGKKKHGGEKEKTKEEVKKEKEEEIEDLKKLIGEEREIIKKKRALEFPCTDEEPEKIQDWLRRLAFDFTCNLVVGKIPASIKKCHNTANILDAISSTGGSSTSSEKKKITIDGFLMDVIMSTEAEFINGTGRGNRRDFLWKLVSKKKPEDTSTSSKLLAVIKVFMVAMTVTVSTNLTWFFRLIAIHTNFQNKMYNTDINRIAQWKNHRLLNNLCYLEACISEAIRLQSAQEPSDETIETQRQHRKKSKEEKNDSTESKSNVVVEEKTMQEKPKMFIPGRWVDGIGCYVGLSAVRGREEKLYCDDYCPSVKKIVHIVVKCVAIEVLSKIKVIDRYPEMKMKLEWINSEKRFAKSRVRYCEREIERLQKDPNRGRKKEEDDECTAPPNN